jgi:MFS family permease
MPVGASGSAGEMPWEFATNTAIMRDMNDSSDNQPASQQEESGMMGFPQSSLPIDGNPFATPQEVAPSLPEAIPPLGRDPSFWGMTVTQFLGAFNDNVFKQLLLLLAIPAVAAATAAAETESDDQWKAMLVFALPFLLFSGFAGFLSDKHSKRSIVVLAKAAEIFVMLMGLAAFYWQSAFGYEGLLVVLFLMGTHSAFFGPAKYGILPEMLHQRDLPRANGIFLMTTFLAIIFGQVSAGFLKENFANALWVASLFCVGIAVAGTISSLLVRSGPPAQPQLRFTPGAFFITKDMLSALLADRPLLMALLVSSTFWMIAGLAQPGVNSLGKMQLLVGDVKTSIMQGAIGVGIMCGCLLAGFLSRGNVSFRIMNIGAWGLVATLALLAPWKSGGEHLLGFWLCLPVLILLGGFTGFFAVPVQVFLQTRSAQAQKGRMIAAMNQVNWIGILVSAILYKVLDVIVVQLGLPRSALFGCVALMMLPIALFYRPADELLSDEQSSSG